MIRMVKDALHSSAAAAVVGELEEERVPLSFSVASTLLVRAAELLLLLLLLLSPIDDDIP